MLTKAVVFLFSIMAVFGLIMGNIDARFSPVPPWTTPEQKEVATYFSSSNYTLYTSSASDAMNRSVYPYSKTDIPTTISTNDWLEIYWETYDFPHLFPQPGLFMRHATQQYFLGKATYKSSHGLIFSLSNGQKLHNSIDVISLDDIVTDYNLSGHNDCIFYGSCEHIKTTLVLTPENSNYTVIQAWNGDTQLIWYLTYEVSLNATGISIWNLISGLFGFSPLSLGIGGVGETIVAGVVAGFMYALVLVLAYKVTTGIIPWVSGGSGD